MIYKFIDNNGSEITVNSLSSLQALVDSETIKKNTKVKAGLRGKWTTAENISELIFEEIKEEQIPEEIIEPEEDIKTFLTKEENKKITKNETVKKEEVEETPNESDEEEIKDIDEKERDEVKDEHDETEREIEDKTYDDENVIGLNFFEAVGMCLKKYFRIRGRASRSEFWYFQLLLTPMSIFLIFIENSNSDTVIILGGLVGILILLLVIPAITVSVRRFHDVNKSGWYLLIELIPFVGWLIVLAMLVEKGTEGKNRFGDYPLKLKKNNK